MTWQQFLESKKVDNTNKQDALMDMVKALQEVFKKYALPTREDAWKKLTDKQGEKKIHSLLKTPSQPLSPFRTLISP
jgi:hypothetical protein